MGDTFENPSSRKISKAKNVVTDKKVSKSCLLASIPKSSSQKLMRHIISFNQGRTVRGTAGGAALFLLKLAALETVRRFSRARCPIVWDGMRVMQVLCLPPFKWIGRWAPFKGLVNVMQTLSRPLLVLSIATAFSDRSTGNAPSDPIDNSQGLDGSQSSSYSPSELSHVQSTLDTRIHDEASQIQSSVDWLSQLYAELQNQGISLPERINEDELHRFHVAANGDFSCLLSSVKKTIQWRETYNILSGQELEIWSNMVFWHGFDVKYRPCLVVRLGLACVSLPSHERPRFLQAVVSQVEHGILHLVDPENPEITVLVDCQGLSPLRFPMQLMRSCSAIFQEHFPNRLGFLSVIRLSPVVRVIAQTFIQVLKPVTRQKLKIEGQTYQKVLTENFQTLPSYLGGICKCKRCSNIGICDKRLHQVNGESNATERRMHVNHAEGMPSSRLNNATEMRTNSNHDQMLLAAAVGILVFWALMAIIAGKYDPEIRLTLPF